MQENNEPKLPPEEEKAKFYQLFQFIRQNKAKIAFGIIIATAIGAIATPAAFYIIWFWNNPMSRDPRAFSIFGGFIGGVTGVIVNVINVAIVGYIAIHLEQLKFNLEQNKIEDEVKLRQAKSSHEAKLRLFIINREWNSEEMFKCRMKAGKLIRKYPTKSLRSCLKTQIGFNRRSIKRIIAI